MKVIVDIPENKFKDHDGSIDLYYMAGALANGMLIPDDATNGDMFEKFFGKDVYCTLIRMMYSSCCEKLKDWWNAPYKGSE